MNEIPTIQIHRWFLCWFFNSHDWEEYDGVETVEEKSRSFS